MNRRFSWILLPSLMLGTSIYSYSEKVSLNEAQSLATEFVRSRVGNQTATVNLEPVYTGGSEKSPLYYVFNLADNKGFVMVSAEAATTPVLGYSFKEGYPVKNMPDGMKWMIAGLEKELKAVPSIQSNTTAEARKKAARKAAARANNGKELSTPKWSQEGPFNAMIPGQPLVGCVGTAMATIMKYYEYPAAGKGSFGGVDFATSYDWDNMRMDNYRNGYSSAEGEAVALLMYHTSKSIDTQYAMSGSSAYEVRVPGALTTYFGYDPGVSYKKRQEVATQEEWDNLIKDEIDAGRPVLYCGQDVSAGHAFVCDGYENEYLHFNWGWGGSADGYFLSTTLNPTVSRTHHYNNLNTIVYNIKPASGTIGEWSPIHITADANQAGIGSDLTDLASGQTFTVRVGNLKNLSHDDFTGKIAVALCDENGTLKTLLSGAQNFNMVSMGYLFNGYQDFSGCQLPSGVSVAAGDRVRIMTQASGQETWLPVAGELLTVNELDPTIATPSSFMVTLPSVAGVTVEGAGSVIRGWNYSFKVVPGNAAEDVVTVKANGITLVPNGTTYTIANVRENQEISILVQKASEVKEKRSFWVGTPGTLSDLIPESETGTIKELTLFGTLDARDFTFMKNSMNLTRLDISGVNITAYGNDQANAIPREAFRGKGSLKEVILPNSVNRLNNGCFRSCGITTITIPSGVSKYEYNVFCGASALRDIYVGRQNAEFINWCVLSGVRVAEVTLHVPNQTAWTNYNKAENWNTIANIIVDPIPAAGNDVIFAVQESNEVKFDTETLPGKMEKGTKVTFQASHIADNDNKMEVYANNTRLTADANGNYSVTLNGNTIVHFDLIAPQPVKEGKLMWSLNDKNGSIGMVTEAVNVIPGQEFTVRLNALDVPQYSDNLYWAVVLTDKDSNIKEFISPVNIWQGGVANNHKYSVTCKVNESKVREGNLIRLVNSNNKKDWYLVKGATENIVDAIPAVNNQSQMYSMNLHGITVREEIETADGQVVNEKELDLEGLATITGVESTALRGQDLTLSIVPTSSVYKVDLKVNGEQVATREASVEYPFVAMKDMDFEINVYNPAVGTTKVINTYRGGLHFQLGENNVAETVKVIGEAYSDDLRAATAKDFAVETIKVLDLSEVKIVARYNGSTLVDAEDELKAVLFQSPTGKTPVVEKIILPESVKRIWTNANPGVFSQCKNIEEITFPADCNSGPFSVEYSSVKQYFLGSGALDGLDNLKIIRIPGAPKTYDGKVCTAHFRPTGCQYAGNAAYEQYMSYYTLGDQDAKKVTVIVPEEHIAQYKKADKDATTGNPWWAYGYNILSEKPIYGVEFDPTRVRLADETMNSAELANFLGDNVPVQTISAEGKIFPLDNGSKATVYVDGEKVELAEDGSIPVTFHNPKFNAELAKNHRIDVEYTLDLNFHATSDLFAISEPEVTDLNASGVMLADLEEGEGEENGEEPATPVVTHTFDRTDALHPVLRDVKENSTVRFKVDFNDENEGLEARVMIGNDELSADEDGYYTLAVSNAGKDIDIFAVPGNGATLNSEELAAIKPEEAKGITSIAFEGELTDEELYNAIACFENLEELDLSKLEGDLPEGAFANMTTLTTVVLPEVSEIGAGMFEDCESLRSVDIPATVGAIGDAAFKGCASLEKLTLTGIHSIGDGAFEGCENLTTITLLASSADPKSDARRKVQKKASRLTSDAFKGVNPNCIVVLDENVDVPAATANYLHTATGTLNETDLEGNVIEREGRVYSAKSDISFIQGYALSIPHAFTLEDGATVSMEAETDKWTPVLVPFNVETIKDKFNQEIELTVAEEDAEEIDNNTVYTLLPGGEELTSTDKLMANTPAFIYSSNSGATIFSASEGQVPATPTEISVEGKDYTLHASYKAQELPAADTYLLDSTCYYFVPENAETEDGEAATVKVNPFELYATSPVKVSSILTGLPGVKDPIETGVETTEMAVKDFKVVKEGDMLVVYSPEDRTELIYSADGRIVCRAEIKAGRNVITLPAAGIYVIADTKVIF